MVRIRHLLTSLWSPPRKRTVRSRVREAQRIKWTDDCFSCVKWSDLPCPHLQIQNNLQHLHTLLPSYLAYKHIEQPVEGGGEDKSCNKTMCNGFGFCSNWMYITITPFLTYSTVSVPPVSSDCCFMVQSHLSEKLMRTRADHHTSHDSFLWATCIRSSYVHTACNYMVAGHRSWRSDRYTLSFT